MRAEARARYSADIEHARALGRNKRAADSERYREIGRRQRALDPKKANDASKLSKRASRAISRDKDRAYAEKNKERKNARSAERYRENAEAICAKARARRLERIAEDPAYAERRREFVRRYHAANPETILAIRRNRKARIRGAEGRHTATDVAAILALQKGKCAHSWCRVRLGEKYDVDHVIAIARGGKNDRRNLQILCRPCNAKKWAKDPINLAREHGMLI